MDINLIHVSGTQHIRTLSPKRLLAGYPSFPPKDCRPSRSVYFEWKDIL